LEDLPPHRMRARCSLCDSAHSNQMANTQRPDFEFPPSAAPPERYLSCSTYSFFWWVDRVSVNVVVRQPFSALLRNDKPPYLANREWVSGPRYSILSVPILVAPPNPACSSEIPTFLLAGFPGARTGTNIRFCAVSTPLYSHHIGPHLLDCDLLVVFRDIEADVQCAR